MFMVLAMLVAVMVIDDGDSNGDTTANGDDDVSESGCERWRW